MSDKICPLMSCNLITKDQPVAITCKEEKCAWWDEEYKACVMIGLKIELVKLGESHD